MGDAQQETPEKIKAIASTVDNAAGTRIKAIEQRDLRAINDEEHALVDLDGLGDRGPVTQDGRWYSWVGMRNDRRFGQDVRQYVPQRGASNKADDSYRSIGGGPNLAHGEGDEGRVDDMQVRIRREGLTWRVLDGEVVALDLQSSTYFTTNVTGGLLWHRLVDGASRSDLIRCLVDAFALDEKAAAADADLFLEELKRLGMLEAVVTS